MFHVEHSRRDEREVFSNMLMFHVEHWQRAQKRVMEVGCVVTLES